MDTLMGARRWRVELAIFLSGGMVACLLLLLMPASYLSLTDALAWRVGRPSVAQARLEQTLTGTQLHIDNMQLDPGVIWFGDSHLQRFPPSLISGLVSNFAISGETAVELAGRLPRYTSVNRARGVVLLTGRNDLMQGLSPDVTLQAFANLLGRLPAGLPVRLVGIPPAREEAHKLAQRKAINNGLQQLCTARAACRYAGLDALADAEGQLQRQFDAGDGVHLNAAGYRLLAGLVNAF